MGVQEALGSSLRSGLLVVCDAVLDAIAIGIERDQGAIAVLDAFGIFVRNGDQLIARTAFARPAAQ